MKPIKKSLYSLLCFCMLASTGMSCKKYLEAKPDRSLGVPATLRDFQALMDGQGMNNLLPYAGDVASDDYFLDYADWSAFPLDAARNSYVWDPKAATNRDWLLSYIAVINCNVVLEGIDKASGAPADKNKVAGQAYFFRGYIFYELANVYTLPYNKSSAGSDLGIPLRLKSDITAKTTRSTLAETYSQIISDFRHAAALLPVIPLVKSRPSKPAAYGALARVYLGMQDYANASLYADSCLQLYSKLIDYNTLDSTAVNPFPLFNDEVIFHGMSTGTDDVVDPYYAKVDTDLYRSYGRHDLRKPMFYFATAPGYYGFKGDYTGQSYGQLFDGIATDEQLLIRSETNIRLGKVAAGIADLNSLLVTRFEKGNYVPYDGNMTADAALPLVLEEKRKELAFRSSIRWSELRRLNQDPRFAKTLTRQLNGKTYTLPPNDKRYAFLLPVSVIQISGVPQNSR
jgi:hypothetical protein